MQTEKHPAFGRRGMVVTNHPLASAAGAEMLAAGGNAIDAAVAALFTLTVVEPMMVGILGGGTAHLRLADGTHTVIDGQSTAPLATGPTTYTPDPAAPPGSMDTIGRRNALGPTAVATPGNLHAWLETLDRFGTFSRADVMEPAIRHAERGFRATAYLHECVADCAADMALDAEIAAVFLPGGSPIATGARLVAGAYADTLRSIVKDGPAVLYGGALGRTLTDHMARAGGYITQDDLAAVRSIERAALRGTYRGYEIIGPPPPTSGPLHVIQMLNILEGFDIGALGFGSAETVHLLAEVLKIAFADRAAATADPAFVDVPVERLLSKDYAAERRREITAERANVFAAGVATAGSSAAGAAGPVAGAAPPAPEGSAYTTHVTVADGLGNIVASTQTINSLFGARYMVPGTGMIPNNYMYVLDPRPGRASSVQAGKRMTSSMAPVIVLRDGKPAFALGLPGGLRIFPSVMQAISNLIDHGMSVQQAVEAPRIWTQGYGLEIEAGIADSAVAALRAFGHDAMRVGNVAGGMGAIRFHDDGMLEGASCWRADGTPIGLGGGFARPGVRFRPEIRRA